MTALSTMLSVIMLPLNLIIYASGSYSSAVVKSLDWYALFMSLFVVIGGISSGLFCSAYFKDAPAKAHQMHKAANRFGNVAGICLITYSIFVSSSDHKAALWDQGWQFFVGIGTPALIGITIATMLASSFSLDKPERVAVAVESCYQNTGIATSVAVVMFDGDKDRLAQAISVPLFYGIVEAVLLACFCLVCWKAGWTKAPADEKLCVILATSYECEEEEAIEQVTGIDNVLNLSDSESNDCELGDGDISLKTPALVFEETDASETTSSEYPLRDPSAGPVVLRKASSQNGIVVEQEILANADLGDDNMQNDDSSRQRSSSETDEAGVGRLGKTISHIKARATGYRRAPLPDENGNVQAIRKEPPSASDQVSAEISNQESQYIDRESSPARQSPPRSSKSDSRPTTSPTQGLDNKVASSKAYPTEGKPID